MSSYPNTVVNCPACGRLMGVRGCTSCRQREAKAEALTAHVDDVLRQVRKAKRTQTWRELSQVAMVHNTSRGFKIHGPGKDCFGIALEGVMAFWFW